MKKKFTAKPVLASVEFSEEEILDMVKIHYEWGKDFDLDDFEGNEDAYNEYFDLLDLGPAGFYREYKDQLKFEPRFAEEYEREDY